MVIYKGKPIEYADQETIKEIARIDIKTIPHDQRIKTEKIIELANQALKTGIPEYYFSSKVSDLLARIPD